MTDESKTKKELIAEIEGLKRQVRGGEARFQEFIDLLPEILFEFNVNGELKFVNNIGFEKFQYSRQDLEQGLEILNMIAPQDRARASENIARIIAGEKIGLNEYTALAKDGSRFPVVLHSSPIIEEGRLTGLRGVAIDISHLKAAEAAIRESEAKYSTFSRNFKGIIFQGGMDFVPIFIHGRLEEITGYTEQELTGRRLKWSQIIHPEDFAAISQDAKRLITEPNISLEREYRIICRDGSIKWIHEIIQNNSEDGIRPSYVQGTLLDITKRKFAEEALRLSQEEYEDLYDNAPDMFLSIDSNSQVIIKCNRMAAAKLGYEKEELIGRSVIDLYHPDYREKAKTVTQEFDSSGETRNIETKVCRKDGSAMDVMLDSTAVRDETGRIVVSRSSFRDITKLKKTEEEKSRLERQFIQAQKMEAVGTLAGGIAHDFNNILMAISGYVSLMVLDLDKAHPHYKYVSRIQQQTESASDLTRHLLGFARGGKYEAKATDINALLMEATEIFGRTKKEISLHTDFGGDLWLAEVDRAQVEQVLLNLFVNAWQAMPEGGDVYLQTENVVLDDSYIKPYHFQPGRYVKISVTDTGIGMDSDVRERVFEPFFSTKEKSRGTGLGLASAYGIVKNHGGLIDVYSEKNIGTTFNVYLPASEGISISEFENGGQITGGVETILLVDDEPAILDVGQELLERLGYKVITAQSGRDALQIFEINKGRIDLVILDLIMPGMGGGPTFDRLKSISPEVKVILSSGYSINGLASEILNSGCKGFIQKPFTLNEISLRIRQAIDDES